MTTTDLGESLVGAYMRHIERCTIVLYNSFFADQQGEVDVVAVKAQDPGQPRLVYLCEVTTHIGGMARPTVDKVPAKLQRLREFADVTFPSEAHRFQWWSPYVSKGETTARSSNCAQTGRAKGGRWSSSSTMSTPVASVNSSTTHARTLRPPTSLPSGCCRSLRGSGATDRPYSGAALRAASLCQYCQRAKIGTDVR